MFKQVQFFFFFCLKITITKPLWKGSLFKYGLVCMDLVCMEQFLLIISSQLSVSVCP